MNNVLALAATLLLTAASPSAERGMFTNPLNPSADPWMGYSEGQYHLSTTQGNRVVLWSAKSLEKLKDAKPRVIWEKGKGVWAAEFHQMKGKNGQRWFCYFTKTDGEDVRHRMFVMESKSSSILGPYGPPKQIETDPKDEFYAIDGTVFEHAGSHYFVWAGHPGHRLFISKMKDPFTLEGERVLIPASGFGCEEVREGPYILKHGKRLFLTYSACDTGKPDYKVGYVWMDENKDPMKAASWTQEPEPLLGRNDGANVFGPGHHNFFKSPDGKEDWIAYHGKTTSEYTYRGRSTRAQKVEWDAEGFPKKIVPLSLDTKIPLPSGDPAAKR
ncbi:glycoside hydrolase family 43 protein [Luteolibacter luteus]|uniref:Family 43 glycosylhydrolase n=1 Tax=Luteolibacter luteus TaxID=2728835 RepID=A0A858RFQ7_9BACT|nr:glycoside hydrolase family 43 protein [Luteolibacter luteus]QJE94973.1 family 43 glycosylhydrolase [Luteolibacter luteus]